jgi:hypothetical protein
MNLFRTCLLIAAAAAPTLSQAQEHGEPVPGNEAPGRERQRRGSRARPVQGRLISRGDNWTARGTGCREDTIQIIENGSVFSIILSDFQLNLPQGDRSHGTDHVIGCTVNITLTPPEGMMFSGVYQTVSGGVVKSEKSRVALRMNYSIGNRGFRASPLIYERGAVGAADPNSLFTMELENLNMPRAIRCREQVKYRMRLQLNGTRANARDEFIMAGVDSLDGEFITNVRPVFVACNR